jgi:2-polyprenyl-3-methyl-5-hydroxy-6-metoxy-1,4-benzoquinol methylase
MEIPKKIYFKLRPLILPINKIISQIPLKANILDLGCGKGLLLNYIKNYKSYTGVDLNLTSNKIKNKNINFVKEDCVKYINQKLNPYDTFLIIDLLHHLNSDTQLNFLKDLLNKLKKNDTIIIKDILPKNLITKFWNSFHDLIISKQIINYFNFKEFENNLSTDYKIIDNFYKRVFLYDHYFLIIKKN